MKLFASLSIFIIIFLIFLSIQTLKKEMVPIPTKEKLIIFQFALMLMTLIWIAIGLFQ